MNKRFTAAALGLALAFLVVGYFCYTSNDMKHAFYPATQAAEPYSQEIGFFYPVWALYFLKVFLVFGPGWGAIEAGLLCIVVALVCSERWGTPAWVSLIAPVLLLGVGYCHPFEALVLLGLTLVSQGHAGLGLMLLAFKPQLGFVPGLYVAWQHRREWRAFVPLALLVIGTTGLDLALTGRLWVIPFCHTIRDTPGLSWNASLWPALGWLSLLWLPIGAWALRSQRCEQRRLFIAYVLGLLLMPYWSALSLWPLVAMAGCWRDSTV